LHEIIVANNRSTDRTSDVIAAFASRDSRVKEVQADRAQGAVFAQNDGVRASTGDFVMLCGADDEVLPGWAKGFSDAFMSGSNVVACEILHRREDGTLIKQITSLSDNTWPGLASVGGGQAGFAKSIFDSVNGFDEAFTGAAEDLDLFWRMQLAGHQVVTIEDAKFNYFARTDPRSIFRQQVSYGRGKAQLYAKHRRAGMPRRSYVLAPLMLGIAAFRILFSAPRSPRRLLAVSTFGYNWGHISGSIMFKCWYF